MDPMVATPGLGAMPPPKGLQPNFENPPNRNAEIITIACLLTSVSTILVAARTYTRLVVMGKSGWEDYLLWMAWPLSIYLNLFGPLNIQNGLGVHLWNVTKSEHSKLLEQNDLWGMIYCPAIGLIKTAIAVQLFHIFVVGKSKLYWAFICFCVFNAAFYLSSTLVCIMVCVPREKIWKPEIPGTCLNHGAALLAASAVNVITDFMLLIVPIVKVGGLQLSTKSKIGVMAVFGTGIFACIASIMRVITTADHLKGGDTSYKMVAFGQWLNAEVTTGIVCCCLPVLPQLYRKRLAHPISSLRSRIATSRSTNPVISSTTSTTTTSSIAKGGFSHRSRPLNDTAYPLIPHASAGHSRRYFEIENHLAPASVVTVAAAGQPRNNSGSDPEADAIHAWGGNFRTKTHVTATATREVPEAGVDLGLGLAPPAGWIRADRSFTVE